MIPGPRARNFDQAVRDLGAFAVSQSCQIAVDQGCLAWADEIDTVIIEHEEKAVFAPCHGHEHLNDPVLGILIVGLGATVDRKEAVPGDGEVIAQFQFFGFQQLGFQLRNLAAGHFAGLIGHHEADGGDGKNQRQRREQINLLRII